MLTFPPFIFSPARPYQAVYHRFCTTALWSTTALPLP